MYTKRRKKELIKNIIFIFFILMIALFSTHYIYYKFQDVHSIDFNSESLSVVYRDPTGDKFSLTKVTPVTDSVGLSSPAYLLTIKNNLTEKISYRIKVIENKELMEEVQEEDKIPLDEIRISVKAGKSSNKIYDLKELL